MITQHPTKSTRALLWGIWNNLSRRRRIQLALLLVVMLISGGAELVSLGTVLPFLAVLTDPDLLWQQPLVRELALKAGFSTANDLLMPTILGFAAAAVFAAMIRLSNLWLNLRLVAAIGSDLSCDAYRRTLYQPYEIHLQRNSSEVITATVNEIARTIVALNSLLQLATSVVVATGLLIGLLAIDALVAFCSAALFGSVYAILAIAVRRRLRGNGLKIARSSRLQLKALQEGLSAIRDVLLDYNQPYYLQIYKQADRPLRQLDSNNVFLGSFPRYVIEALALVSVAIVGGLFVAQRGSGASVIPLLGALALGSQRLLPAFQQIYSGWAALKSYNASMNAVLNMLNQPLPSQLTYQQPIQLFSDIRLEKVHFSYGSEQKKVLKGLDLEIQRGERIGLIGSTGSGKSTLVDILMGLLEPGMGRVLVNGEDIHDSRYPERLLAWRAAIAHVPQTIYLADSTIAENIAFGVPRDKINFAKVRMAAEKAQIADFIESRSERYSSLVGEHGVCLSGGQMQRIGLARALYKNANLIFLDEATSALDNATEEAVMHAIETLSRDITIVMIAHRLTTVERCDRIIVMEDGFLKGNGPTHEMLPPFS